MPAAAGMLATAGTHSIAGSPATPTPVSAFYKHK